MDANERQVWLAWRRAGIGSSDAPAIAGVDPYRGPMSVWLDKTGRREDDSEEFEYQRWGKLLEPAIAKEFEVRTGLFVRQQQMLVEHPERAWQRATVDGLVFDLPPGLHEASDPPMGPLEIKTVAGFKSPAWGTQEDPTVPEHFQLQVQHQLSVTGLERAWMAVLFGGQRLELREVPRDDALIDSLVRMETAFWQRVQDDVPPAGSGLAGDTAALQAAFGKSQAAEVDLPDNAETLIADRNYARALVGQWQTQQAAAEQALMAMLQDAEVGTRNGRALVTWKPQTRKAYTAKAATFRVLRIVGRADEEADA